MSATGLPYVGVVGPSAADALVLEAAEDVGAGLASAGCLVVTGGLGGVMEAACRGAKSRRGPTLGLLPGLDRGEANGWVDVAVATGLEEVRNALIVRTCDALVAVGRSPGTLTEVAFALRDGKPVVALGPWEGVDGIEAAASAGDAVARVLARLPRR